MPSAQFSILSSHLSPSYIYNIPQIPATVIKVRKKSKKVGKSGVRCLKNKFFIKKLAEIIFFYYLI